MSKTNFLVLTFLSFVFGFILATTIRAKKRIEKFEKQEESFLRERDSLQYQIDSLSGELSTKSIDMGRYEIIMDRLWVLDSPLVEKVSKNLE